MFLHDNRRVGKNTEIKRDIVFTARTFEIVVTIRDRVGGEREVTKYKFPENISCPNKKLFEQLMFFL